MGTANVSLEKSYFAEPDEGFSRMTALAMINCLKIFGVVNSNGGKHDFFPLGKSNERDFSPPAKSSSYIIELI